ncbi:MULTISPECIES: L-serine ammonia-lyase [unclassified Arcicella]|uniref:L-serine ammonia-lyase n=1 Tax=unclassified Arcicella TaxID=2644986 RepID=UPI002854E0B3|nr:MULTISPECIES: L-serine ammonia-lyase [unclassified Arcicella]MDR6563697.1 L-serine dehydratase [Arcicella sp. BE51]MDR6814781.1 L-serine dehydratase [Arcicella sp. BE140]MDR6826215.1 L-serine dehydratase [Arcicella sp. BE139]
MYSQAITTSIFDLFKVGPGPSSSHTIGPMKAAYDFLTEINRLPTSLISDTLQIEIYLYGSLSATGKGHGTDRAIIAGLLGWKPDACDPVKFLKILKNPDDKYPVKFHDHLIAVNADSFHFERGKYDSPHANTMVLKLKDESTILLEHEYYSIGGGFIYRKGEKQHPKNAINPPYPYTSMKELKAHLNREKISLTELMLANEMALTGVSKKEIEQKVDGILDFMHKAVKRGLKDKRVLPGTIKLRRKAPLLYERAKNLAITSDSFLIFLNAYCLAASEENAAGNIVVTAPTSGASGVIPGITYLIKNHFHYTPSLMRDGMWAAAAIGFLVKHNASISGAEMGCMGEIGTASAMAAAMLTYCATKDINAMESAAEIGIEHHLGMTCDPIGGYVQIPCIERNAMGAVKSYNAFLLATSGDSSLQKISFDSVIKVMKATGKDMSKKYKETSEAGLALSATEC